MPRQHLQQLIDRRLKYRELERYQLSQVLLIILASCHNIITRQEFQDMNAGRSCSSPWRYGLHKKTFSSSAWWTNFHSISFSLTCPNVYQPYKYWRDTAKTAKPKIKSTNFIWFASMKHCPSALFVYFVAASEKKAMRIANTPLLKPSGVSVRVPMWSAYLRNFKGTKSE